MCESFAASLLPGDAPRGEQRRDSGVSPRRSLRSNGAATTRGATPSKSARKAHNHDAGAAGATFQTSASGTHVLSELLPSAHVHFCNYCCIFNAPMKSFCCRHRYVPQQAHQAAAAGTQRFHSRDRQRASRQPRAVGGGAKDGGRRRSDERNFEHTQQAADALVIHHVQ